MSTFIEDALPVALPILGTAAAVVAGAHVVLRVKDARAAVGWLGIVVLLPFVGPLVYWVFGINRVRRRALALWRRRERPYPVGDEDRDARLALGDDTHLLELAHLIDNVTVRPLVPRNHIEPLVNGDAGYAAMLDAIESATHSVTLVTYIFDRDEAGMRFVIALGRAVQRGVAVRVLIDAVGARYSFPTVLHELRLHAVTVARFNPTLFPWRWAYTNLRNHRKIVVVDGRVGFTGGLNIRHGHCVAEAPRHPVLDLHFKVEGPVVGQMQRCFAEDWHFTTGERLDESFFPELAPTTTGDVFARGISDGPDIDVGKLRWAVLGALACARQRVRIVTPYFLPEADLLAGLMTAVLRGVVVEVILPERNNQLLVKWASAAILPELVAGGCQVFATQGPFDHSKVIVVDDAWVLLGSANLDPRSLRLNFEFNIECYSADFARRVGEIIDVKLTGARRVTLGDFAEVGLARRLRNGVARLFVPYL
ncbi:MAG: phospholipase D-like domain-containing protein [Myxococcota bacterium]